MSIWTKLIGALGNKTRLFLLDADSDKLIIQKCRFNPFHVNPHYKNQVTSHLKFLIENNPDDEFTIPEMAVWKLGFYINLLTQAGAIKEFEQATLGLKIIYEENELSLRDEIKLGDAIKILTLLKSAKD
jgi:hypothetical protein